MRRLLAVIVVCALPVGTADAATRTERAMKVAKRVAVKRGFTHWAAACRGTRCVGAVWTPGRDRECWFRIVLGRRPHAGAQHCS